MFYHRTSFAVLPGQRVDQSRAVENEGNTSEGTINYGRYEGMEERNPGILILSFEFEFLYSNATGIRTQYWFHSVHHPSLSTYHLPYFSDSRLCSRLLSQAITLQPLTQTPSSPPTSWIHLSIIQLRTWFNLLFSSPYCTSPPQLFRPAITALDIPKSWWSLCITEAAWPAEFFQRLVFCCRSTIHSLSQGTKS